MINCREYGDKEPGGTSVLPPPQASIFLSYFFVSLLQVTVISSQTGETFVLLDNKA